MPKVTIVLPTYNGEKYIKQSIDSIISQDFKEWELIIVNDCSTDSTTEIINLYAQKDERIRIIHNDKNQKLPEALNIGFREARGECLTWTSDDNIYLSNAIGEMYQMLISDSNIKMVSADMEFIDAGGEIVGHSPSYEDERMLYQNCVGACFMYKRQVLEQVGEYDTEMFCVEDYDYWLRILFRYGKINHLAKTLYLYRYHDNSLTATKQKKIKKQLCKVREKYSEFILEKLSNNKDIICTMYYEFLEICQDESLFVERVCEMIPELKHERKTLKEAERYIIFGAGKIGEIVFKELEGKVAFFIDNDVKKKGMMKCGLKINDISILRDYKEDYTIVIAVSNCYIYQIMHQLKKEGMVKYISYPLFKLR